MGKDTKETATNKEVELIEQQKKYRNIEITKILNMNITIPSVNPITDGPVV